MAYITTGKAAALCGVGINTIKRWIQKGELQCVITPGGHWRIAEDEFQRFMDRFQLKSAQLDPIVLESERSESERLESERSESERSESERSESEQSGAVLKQAYKVLLIEDDQALTALIEGAFHLAEFDTLFDCAGDGYSGLMKIGAMQPDLLILDIMLPEMNGLELLQRIRTSKMCPTMKIMVVTGAADHRLVKRSLDQAGLDRLFHKPFSIQELIIAAHELLSLVERKSAWV